jgi:hypothetical protein
MGPGFPHGSSPWAEGPREHVGSSCIRTSLPIFSLAPSPGWKDGPFCGLTQNKSRHYRRLFVVPAKAGIQGSKA